MKKFDLRQLIKEELKKALSEITYGKGDVILWKGSRVEVIEDEGEATLKIQLPNGQEKLVFRKDTFVTLNENYPSLQPVKNDIATAIENSDIPNEEFAPQADKGVVVDFIRGSNPSEAYLNNMLDILKKNDVVFNIEKKEDKDVDMDFTEDPEVNPYEMPGGKPSKDGYTGD
jgi:hypothetical protein